jgi:hypothetical protein
MNDQLSGAQLERHQIEARIGLVLFFVTLLYVLAIVVFGSRKNNKFVVSKNALRHLLDGLTLATGCTILFAFWDELYFTVVAANAVYITVTSLTCIFGPLINLAERYGRVLDN